MQPPTLQEHPNNTRGSGQDEIRGAKVSQDTLTWQAPAAYGGDVTTSPASPTPATPGSADGPGGTATDASGSTATTDSARGSARWGLTLGIASYAMWGTLPLYFPLLQPAGALEIIAHRIVWSLLFCLVLLLATRQMRGYLAVMRSGRMLAVLSAAAVLVAANWTIYVFAVTSDHVVDAALGYFINPLVTVLLAVLVLKERLRPAQWVALGFGGAAVVVITAGLGTVPWVALGVAFSFGFYGLLKNRAGRTVPAIPGLAVETTVLAPVAVLYLLWLGAQGTSTFVQEGTGHALLLVSSGIVTALPLLCFGAAARLLPLSVVGMLQYLAPIMQLALGVLVFHEEMPVVRWVGFSLVWCALVLLTVDALRSLRVARVARVAQR